MLYSDTGKDGKQSRETSPPEVSPKGRGSKVVLSWYGSLSFYRSTLFESLLIRKSPVVPASRHRCGLSRPERRGCSRRHAELPSLVPARERHPASDLQESHPPLSRTCVRSLRYWLSQARFSGFRPIVSGPASYSCFSFSFLPGHAFCLSAFRRAPHFAPFLTLYRPLFSASISVLVPAPILFPSRSCTCCSTNPRPYLSFPACS